MMTPSEVIREYNLWRITVEDSPETFEDHLFVRELIGMLLDGVDTERFLDENYARAVRLAGR